jgi:hypothetical protein
MLCRVLSLLVGNSNSTPRKRNLVMFYATMPGSGETFSNGSRDVKKFLLSNSVLSTVIWEHR